MSAVWGHSGGGYATADAMFRYPDFFKVGWSESGNHDNRNYEDDWAEKWLGLDDAATKKAYDDQANQNIAKNLKGKLMLVHGTMDDNVPPTNTLLVVDALMKAGKDFDLLMIPNAHHGLRGRGAVHRAPPLGLLRHEPDGSNAAQGVQAGDASERPVGTGAGLLFKIMPHVF